MTRVPSKALSDTADARARADFVSSYTPAGLSTQAWASLAGEVRALVLMVSPTLAVARKMAAHAAAFALWTQRPKGALRVGGSR